MQIRSKLSYSCPYKTGLYFNTAKIEYMRTFIWKSHPSKLTVTLFNLPWSSCPLRCLTMWNSIEDWPLKANYWFLKIIFGFLIFLWGIASTSSPREQTGPHAPVFGPALSKKGWHPLIFIPPWQKCCPDINSKLICLQLLLLTNC